MIINPKIFDRVEQLNKKNLNYFIRYEEILNIMLNVEFSKQCPDLLNLIDMGSKAWFVACVEFVDIVEDSYVLKVNLFEEIVSTGSYKKLCALIRSENCMNNMGHLNNPQDYEVYSGSRDKLSETVFDSLNIEDLDKAKEVIIEYYSKAKPALKLVNFLNKGFLANYESL